MALTEHKRAYVRYLESLTVDPPGYAREDHRFPVVGGYTGHKIEVAKKDGKTEEQDKVVCHHAWPAPLRENGAHGCIAWFRASLCVRDRLRDGVFCNFYLERDDSK